MDDSWWRQPIAIARSPERLRWLNKSKKLKSFSLIWLDIFFISIILKVLLTFIHSSPSIFDLNRNLGGIPAFNLYPPPSLVSYWKGQHPNKIKSVFLYQLDGTIDPSYWEGGKHFLTQVIPLESYCRCPLPHLLYTYLSAISWSSTEFWASRAAAASNSLSLL